MPAVFVMSFSDDADGQHRSVVTQAASRLRIIVTLLLGSLVAVVAGAQEPMVVPSPGFPSVRAGTVEVVPLARSPLNEAMRSALLARRDAQLSQGWTPASEEQAQVIDSYFEDDRVKRRLKPTLLDIDSDLQVAPAQIKGTLLGTGRIEGAMAAGGFVNGRWTGLARVITVPELGRVVLEEYDYRAAGSYIVIAEEVVDSELNGYPVLYNVWRTPSGKGWTEVRWFTPNKEFRLYIGREIRPSDRWYEQVCELLALLS